MMGVPQLFHCPNCNAGLDLGSNGAAVIRCEYCQSVVIVPESLRGKAVSQEAVQVNAQKPQRPNEPDLTEAEATARITALARSGQQIEAMKLYRETYPVGLKAAKEAIDQAASGQSLPIPDIRWEDEEVLPMAAAEEITGLAALGKLDEAAGLYRVTFGTSHLEAKTAVEQLAAGRSIDVARSSARKESQAAAVRLAPTQGPGNPPFKVAGLGIYLIILFAIIILAVLILIIVF